MKKLVSSLFITMDGVVEDPHIWQGTFDEGINPSMEADTENTDTIVLGRVTYDFWMPYWTTATTDLDFAKYINETPKYVVSKTLQKVEWGEWNNATLLKDNLAEEFAKLKQGTGKDITVNGSVSLVQYLIEQQILDELTLYVHPVVAGKGKRLFKDNSALQRFQLKEGSLLTSGGTAILRYQLLKNG